MEFYAPWNVEIPKENVTVSGLRAKGKIRDFLECRAKTDAVYQSIADTRLDLHLPFSSRICFLFPF